MGCFVVKAHSAVMLEFNGAFDEAFPMRQAVGRDESGRARGGGD